MSGEDMAAMLRVTHDIEQGNERLSEQARFALFDQMLEAFKAWGNRAGFSVDKWTVSGRGLPVNPLGDEMFPHDAALSLQRISEFAALDGGELVKCFFIERNHTDQKPGPVIPCALTKSGKPTLLLWAFWDGKACIGEARQGMPAKPAILVSLEGGGPEDGEWKDPAKLYALMEFGFRLGPYQPIEPIDMSKEQEEVVPF